jgi:hypothetical protein
MASDDNAGTFIDDAKGVLRGLNDWAERKIASGAPASEMEAVEIESVEELLREPPAAAG